MDIRRVLLVVDSHGDVIGRPCVPAHRRGVLVLREGRLLGRVVGGVVADDVAQEQGVGHAMRYMELCSQLVGHGVADSQKGVGECHACDGRGVVHLLPGLLVITVAIGLRQVLEDHACSLEAQSVGVVGGHAGGKGLQGMGQDIQTAACRQALGLAHGQFTVDDGHARGEGIVGDGPLHTGFFIGDDGKRSDLAAGSAGGGDADKLCLLSHVGEGVDAFLDIHEPEGEAFELHLRMLIEQPHDLCCIHRGSSAQADEHIGLEGVDELHPLGDRCQGRVGFDLVEGLGLDAQAVQGIGDFLDHPAGEEEGVGDDESALLALQFAQCNGQRAVLEVDFGRQFEPEHVFSPCSFGLDVQQVLGPYVLADGVVAPAAAAQGQGRFKAEVVDIADCTLAGGHVHQDSAGLYGLAEGFHFFGLCLVDVQDAGMAEASQGDQLGRLVGSVTEVVTSVHGQNRAEFFVGERFGLLDRFDLSDKDLCGCRYRKTCKFSDFCGTLSDYGRIDGLTFGVDDHLAKQVGLLGAKKISTAVSELFLHCIIDVLMADHSLLGSADNPVVEGLGHENGAYRHLDIGALVHQGRGVAGADSDGRNAGRVGAFHHGGTSGCKNEVYQGIAHQVIGLLDGRFVDPGDDVLGCSSLYSRLEDDAGCKAGALLGSGMGAEDDGIAGLQAYEALEDGGAGRVGGGYDAADDSLGLGDFLDAEACIGLDYPAGFLVLVLMEDVLGCKVVLDDLVLDNAHAGLSDGHGCELDALVVCCYGSCPEYGVNLLLGIG